MLDSGVSLYALVAWSLWSGAMILISAGWLLNTPALGQFGIAAVGGAVALAIIKDNRRTRRLVRRMCSASNERR